MRTVEEIKKEIAEKEKQLERAKENYLNSTHPEHHLDLCRLIKSSLDDLKKELVGIDNEGDLYTEPFRGETKIYKGLGFDCVSDGYSIRASKGHIMPNNTFLYVEQLAGDHVENIKNLFKKG